MSNSKAKYYNTLVGAAVLAGSAVAAYLLYSHLSSTSAQPNQQSATKQPQSQQAQQRAGRAEQPVNSTTSPATPTPGTPPSATTSEPTTPTNTHPATSPLHWTSRAKQATSQKNVPAAIHAWSKAIELDPTQAKYLNNRANQYILADRWEAAQVDAEESLRVQVYGNAGAHYVLGRCMRKQERYVEAVVQFERAIAEGADTKVLPQVERALNDVRRKAASAQSAAVKPAAATSATPSTTSTSSSTVAAPSRPAAPPAFVASVALPSMRRQDTEQDLVAHEKSEDDDDSGSTFPANQPPVSFANVVSKAESAHQQEVERFPTLADQQTYPSHPLPSSSSAAPAPIPASVTAPAVPSPMVVSVQPGPGYHGSFAAVAANAAREEEEKKAVEEETRRKAQENDQARQSREQKERLERARKEEEGVESKQEKERQTLKAKKVESAEERRTRERIEKAEAADAVRVRQVSGAEEQLLRALSPSAVPNKSASSSSFFSSQPAAPKLDVSDNTARHSSNELTDSGVLVDRADGAEADEQDEDESEVEEFPTPSASRPHKAIGQSEPAAHSAPQSVRPIVPVTVSGSSWATMAKSLASEGSGSAPVSLPSSAPSSPKQTHHGNDVAHVPAMPLTQPVSAAKPTADSPSVAPASAANRSAPPSPSLPPAADKVEKRQNSDAPHAALPPPSPKQPINHTGSSSGSNSNGQPKPATPKPAAVKPPSPSISPALSPLSPRTISPTTAAAPLHSTEPTPAESAAAASRKAETSIKSPKHSRKPPTATNTNNTSNTATSPSASSTSTSTTPYASPKLPPRSSPAAAAGPTPVEASNTAPVKAAGGKSWAAMAAGKSK